MKSSQKKTEFFNKSLTLGNSILILLNRLFVIRGTRLVSYLKGEKKFKW